ncbi:pyridoxal phosphate-dependent aminotransferase [Natronorubrum sp. FCH18a]|uniref:pyridoxal phosphate-dependent aminotransferase n=1 Tax=Natronorubrum sp. FCH18a TaxID=3447018 RepID=UPI003F519029
MQAKRMTDIPFSGIREIFEECNRLEAKGQDVVHFEIGRPDFDTPAPIKAAGKQAIDDGHVYYTSNYGLLELRNGIARKFADENGLEYDQTDEIVVTSGATEAIFVTILALVDPGDEVLVPDPHWTYEPAINAAGGSVVPYRLNPEDGFQPDEASLREAVSDDTKLLIVNTPQNPTGGVLNEAGAEVVRDVAVEHDLLVLSDEIYEKIIYGSPHRSIAAMDGMFERTVTVNGFSKAYSMTGWRLGYLAAPTELIDPIIRLRQYTSTCASSISQYAGLRALKGDLHKPLVDAFAERREILLNRIDGVPGMSCPEPQGAFYAMPTIPDGAIDAESFVWELLRDKGVATVPGTVFGSTGEGRVRLAYSISTERIEEAFDRIEEWVKEQ